MAGVAVAGSSGHWPKIREKSSIGAEGRAND
jgi:hypothetical protein